MIQFRRGKTKSWKKLEIPLAAGQPGYDTTKHKIKIGNGKKLWKDLPYASGLFEEEIFNSENEAKKKKNKGEKEEPIPFITYGSENPDKGTVGKLYLQYYDSEPETDYVVEYGQNEGWTYRKWHSGYAECWGTFKVTTSVQTSIEKTKLYINDPDVGDAFKNKKYPFDFKGGLPVECASLQTSGSIAWLAGKSPNNMKYSASYNIISPDNLNTAIYQISLQVKGRWKDKN